MKKIFLICLVIILAIPVAQSQTGSDYRDKLLESPLAEASIEEIKTYMRTVLDMDLPQDYTCPEHVVNARSAEEASAAIAERYPNFYNKQSNNLVNAVRVYPEEFKQMIFEYKALRANF